MPSRPVTRRLVPSAVFKAMLPEKPSVTTTSTSPEPILSPSTKPRNCIGRRAPFSTVAAARISPVPFNSSSPMLSRATLGRSSPSTVRANAAPITANCTRLVASHSVLAPRSSITDSDFSVGSTAARAGRSMPGMVRSENSDIAIRAPVLPAETAALALPCFTASMAMPIDVVRARRRAWLGLSLMATTSSLWMTSARAARRGQRASSAAITGWWPNSRKERRG